MKRKAKVNLILGGTGFFGKCLAAFYAGKGERIVSTFKSDAQGLKETDRISLVRCDATREEDIVKVVGECLPDRIFYLAAQGSVRKAWEDPVGTTNVNFIGGLYVLEAIHKLGLDSKFVVFSSGVAYGETHEHGKRLKEDARLLPKDPYGLSKLAIDLAGRMYSRSYGMDTLMLRFVNIVGPEQSAKFSLANFARQIAGIEKGHLKPEIRVGNLSSYRDYLDIRDTLRAIDLALAKGERGGVYNIGSGVPRKLADVLDEFIALSTLKKGGIRIVRDPSLKSKDEIPSMGLDASKLRRLTGWRPEIPFRRTLTDILNYWREHWDEK